MAGPLAQSYHDILTRAGHAPQPTAEGYLTFQHEGGQYYLLLDEKDPQFFQLVYPNFHAIHNENTRLRAFVAAGRVNDGIKSAKIMVNENNVWACVELFVVSVAHAETFLRAALAAVQAAVQKFEQEMRENDGIERG